MHPNKLLFQFWFFLTECFFFYINLEVYKKKNSNRKFLYTVRINKGCWVRSLFRSLVSGNAAHESSRKAQPARSINTSTRLSGVQSTGAIAREITTPQHYTTQLQPCLWNVKSALRSDITKFNFATFTKNYISNIHTISRFIFKSHSRIISSKRHIKLKTIWLLFHL